MSASSVIAPQSRSRPAAPGALKAPPALRAMIWSCAVVSLVVGIIVPLGFAPLPGLGDKWAHEFSENGTAFLTQAVRGIALGTAACFVLAGLLAMSKQVRPRTIVWIRHLMIAGYVLIGVQLYTGVRILNLIWEKNLYVEIAPPTPQIAPSSAKASVAPATAPTTRPAEKPVDAPNPTHEAKVTPAPAAKPAPAPRPAGPGAGPTMKTDGIDLDAPVAKPAPPPETPAPATPKPSPAPRIDLTPSPKPPAPAPQQAATQPATRPAVAELTPPPDASSSAAADLPAPTLIVNQYQLYFESIWNKIGLAVVLVLIGLVVGAQLLAWDLSRAVARAAAQDQSLKVDREDQAYHSNLDTSIIVHVIIILILPLLLQLHMARAGPPQLEYDLPGGGGGGQPIQVKVAKKKPPKKIKKYVFNHNSAISFFQPKMDDSRVMATVDDATLNQYEVNTSSGSGKGHGHGRGNGRGSGFGNGTGKVRFLHLEYGGADSADGIADNKDGTFMSEWKERCRKDNDPMQFGGVETVIPFQLHTANKAKLPPVIFLTGDVNGLTAHDTQYLREYVMAGGMLFADPQDKGGYQQHFESWAEALVPGKRMIPVDNKEDPIFHAWYDFPSPPAFWSGNRSFLGIKIEGRWAVICDRGRMADGWKSPINEDCIRMGINIIWYAHDQYFATHH